MGALASLSLGTLARWTIVSVCSVVMELSRNDGAGEAIAQCQSRGS